VLDRPVRHVAIDLAAAYRIAAGAADGVMLSQDGGASWTVLDPRLPQRVYNTVAFAGDRLLVGSHGNGVFWLTLPVSSVP
jgi:photosystem II stability/assembly factor-like uncharacterized protein